jgi:phosphoribosylamine--glycine ligase
VSFSDDVAVTVVLASENYPENPITGREIMGLAEAGAIHGVTIAHAATAFADNGEPARDSAAETMTPPLVATGGRVLSVVALGTDFTQARARAYEALGHIHLEGGQFRTDIAAKVATQ